MGAPEPLPDLPPLGSEIEAARLHRLGWDLYEAVNDLAYGTPEPYHAAAADVVRQRIAAVLVALEEAGL